MRRRLLILSLFLTLFTALTAQAQDNTHIVRRGESLFRIAGYYGTDVTTLAQLNNITNTWQIYAGQVLVLPSNNAAAAAPAEAAAPPQASVAAQTHTVGRGETLVSIARAYGLSPDALAQQNNITNPNLIYAGQRLIILSESAPASAPANVPASVPTAVVLAPPAPAEVAAPAAQNGVQHVVQPGEYLAGIAARYGVNWTAIAQANNIYDPDTVFAGQTLFIPSPTYSGESYGITPVLAAPPPPTGVGREILVDLSDSRVYAYENGVLVRNVLASTGRAATPTVQGDFTIQRKYGAQTMSGPGYYLPDVPYVLYFYAGYALHGTYWHSNWGQPMSHGCVNLPTSEAEWFYSWADVGTPVRVRA
jgi:LysM repeat protein